MHLIHPSSFLRRALGADAVVSAAVALLQLLASAWLSNLLAMPRVLLVETGAFLVGYVLLLLAMASTRRLWSMLVKLVIAGNVGWAVACLALLSTDLVGSTSGTVFVLIQAAAVLVFAALEARGLHRSSAAGASTAYASR